LQNYLQRKQTYPPQPKNVKVYEDGRVIFDPSKKAIKLDFESKDIGESIVARESAADNWDDMFGSDRDMILTELGGDKLSDKYRNTKFQDLPDDLKSKLKTKSGGPIIARGKKKSEETKKYIGSTKAGKAKRTGTVMERALQVKWELLPSKTQESFKDLDINEKIWEGMRVNRTNELVHDKLTGSWNRMTPAVRQETASMSGITMGQIGKILDLNFAQIKQCCPAELGMLEHYGVFGERSFEVKATEATQAEVDAFLNQLRESGVTNMFGATDYIQREFMELNKDEARKMLTTWMKNFGKDKKD